MVHIWWCAPKYGNFGSKYSDLYMELPKYILINTQWLFSFKKNYMSLPKHIKRLISYIILATKVTITRCWNQPGITFDFVIQKFNWVMINDKLACMLHNSPAFFWQNVTTLDTIFIYEYWELIKKKTVLILPTSFFLIFLLFYLLLFYLFDTFGMVYLMFLAISYI